MAVKILIDSASDFTKQEAEEKGLIFLPMEITVGDKIYSDGVDLLPKDFYEILESATSLPKTSQITAYTYQEKIQEIVDNGDEVIVITISSKLSATYNNAERACQNNKGKAFAVDSLNACLGEKILALYALELVESVKSAQEIFAELEIAKTKIKVFALIDTLEYLKKGGRLSGAAAVVGSLLNIKPIISVDNGEIKNIGKAMGLKKGFKALMDTIFASGEIDYARPYGVIFSGNDTTNLHKFLEYANDIWSAYTSSPYTSILGSTIGTHIGPGAIGLAYFTK